MISQGKGVRPVLVTAVAILFLCALSSLASAVLIDLGSYSVQDPRITVNYTEDVFLLSATLVNLDPSAVVAEYTLRQVPPKDPAAPTYIRSYRLYTGTEENPEYLVSGHYQLTLEAIDRQGRAALDIVEFEITGLDILMLVPRFGFSATTPFNVVLRTEIAGEGTDASCWYSRVSWDAGITRIDAQGSYAQEHTINDLAYNGYLYVSCTERTGRETRQRFLVGRDGTPPVINATAVPPIVSDPRDKSTIVRVLTDDNSSCMIDDEEFPGENPSQASTYRKLHEKRIYYNQIADTSLHEITHLISCMNLAELQSEESLMVTVNFGAFVGITVLEPSTAYMNTSSFTLRIRPTFDATACDVNRQPMQAKPDEEWTAAFTNLPNGKVALNITCSGNGKNATLNHSVTVDTTKPVIGSLTPLATLCSGNAPKATAEWNASDVGGVASFVFNVTQGNKSFASDTTVVSRATVSLPKGTNGTIKWSVFAIDLAGNVGVPVSKDAICNQSTTPDGWNGTNTTKPTNTTNSTNTTTAFPPLTCTNGRLDIGEEDIDCGGSCIACQVCFDDSECEFDEFCGLSGVCIPGSGPSGDCFSDDDCRSGEQCIGNTCVVDARPPGCFSDLECGDGEQCIGGSCVGPLTEPEGTDWLALSLLIVGLLVMGGTGWFLYQHDAEKRMMQAREQMSRPPARATSGSPAGSSAQRPYMPVALPPRQPAAPVQKPDRAAQRRESLGAFDQKGTAAKPQPKSEQQKPAKPTKDDDEEVFDDLDKIAKK